MVEESVSEAGEFGVCQCVCDSIGLKTIPVCFWFNFSGNKSI